MAEKLVLVVLFICYASTTIAGKLDQFEVEATKPTEDSTSQQSTPQQDNQLDYDDDSERDTSDDISNVFIEVMAEFAFYSVVYGGVSSWEKVQPSGRTNETQTPREFGDPAIPFARIDVNYQSVNSDIDARDSRVELGFGPFGVQYRRTKYDEDNPDDSLTIEQWHGLYRMSLGDYLEIDLGYGRFTLDGNATSRGSSFTLPVLYRPTKNIGIEWRPTWSSINGSDISDHDLGIHFRYQIAALRVGYRWLEAGEADLNGPYIGLAMHF